MASSRLSATKIGVGALIALTLATAVATVVNLQSGSADSVPTAIATSRPDTGSGASDTVNPGSKYAIDLLTARGNSTVGVVREKTLADLLPNHKFVVGDSKPVALAAGIVVGTVSDVSPGAAFTFDTAGEPVEVDFDDPSAAFRDLIITVSVESALGEVSGDAEVAFVIDIDGSADVNKAVSSFASLGRVIAVLDNPGRNAFEPNDYSVRQSGALFGVVREDGAISFPRLGGDNGEFLDGTDTVAEVLTKATGPDVISKVERAGSTPSTD